MLRFRLAAAVVLLVLGAAACGGNHDSSGGGPASPVEIKVFAAASLTEVLSKLQPEFTAAHPDIRLTFSFAGSQALATQIQQGAPADVFASADTTTMDKVKDLVGTPKLFASNLLQIVVEPGNPRRVERLADLGRGDLKVVLAAPEVPAGRYARQALDGQKITVEPVSLENDVKAVVNKVALGEADAGIVYVSDALAAKGKVDRVDIPVSQNVPATYPVATVKASAHQREAQAFLGFLLSAQGQQTLKSFGFLPPPRS
jgi:molybdate transport system substrate-binding protein